MIILNDILYTILFLIHIYANINHAEIQHIRYFRELAWK
jgi:hypothetical protein